MSRELELLDALTSDRSVMHEDDVDDGACYYCGCTGRNACVLGDPPQACGWHRKPDHRGFAVCSNPECVKDYLADPGAP